MLVGKKKEEKERKEKQRKKKGIKGVEVPLLFAPGMAIGRLMGSALRAC